MKQPKKRVTRKERILQSKIPKTKKELADILIAGLKADPEKMGLYRNEAGEEIVEIMPRKGTKRYQERIDPDCPIIDDPTDDGLPKFIKVSELLANATNREKMSVGTK